MKFDFKITTWERVSVPKAYEQTVLKAIKDGVIKTSSDIYLFLVGKGAKHEDIEFDVMEELSQQMLTSENEDRSTIEVVDNVHYGKGMDIVWENGLDHNGNKWEEK